MKFTCPHCGRGSFTITSDRSGHQLAICNNCGKAARNLASASSSETPGRTKQKGTKHDELDALLQVHQKARRAADRIARLKALRLARDAEAPKEANEPTAKANEKPTMRKLRPAKYLGGYE